MVVGKKGFGKALHGNGVAKELLSQMETTATNCEFMARQKRPIARLDGVPVAAAKVEALLHRAHGAATSPVLRDWILGRPIPAMPQAPSSM